MRLERSMLFVPASRWGMIEKAAAIAADAVCLDLEDSVAVDDSPSSRGNVIRALRSWISATASACLGIEDN
jgi:citrate lyase beta subunit